jgi:hypothetical protein
MNSQDVKSKFPRRLFRIEKGEDGYWGINNMVEVSDEACYLGDKLDKIGEKFDKVGEKFDKVVEKLDCLIDSSQKLLGSVNVSELQKFADSLNNAAGNFCIAADIMLEASSDY